MGAEFKVAVPVLPQLGHQGVVRLHAVENTLKLRHQPLRLRLGAAPQVGHCLDLRGQSLQALAHLQRLFIGHRFPQELAVLVKGLKTVGL